MEEKKKLSNTQDLECRFGIFNSIQNLTLKKTLKIKIKADLPLNHKIQMRFFKKIVNYLIDLFDLY